MKRLVNEYEPSDEQLTALAKIFYPLIKEKRDEIKRDKGSTRIEPKGVSEED